MSNKELEALRKSINELDKSLLELFSKRRQLSLEVAKYKYDNALDIRDQTQEQKLLTQLLSSAKALGLDTSSTLSLFHNIIEDSLRTQYDFFLAQESKSETSQIALLGDSSSYSAIAARNHFSTKAQECKPVYFNSFQQIFEAVKAGKCDFGLIPIENTSSGNIPEIHDLIRDYDIYIVGEEKLRVKHCLIGLEQATLESIKDVYSHPQALLQSKEFLQEHPNMKTHLRSSTSAAIKLVEEYQNPAIAAIASEEAALNSGLKIIQDGINQYEQNFTRFILIANDMLSVPKKVPAKTSLMLTTQQQAGSLADCLLILKQQNINMTKIESRPIVGKAWKERFYLDIEGNIDDYEISKAVHQLELMANDLKVLGCYPQHDILATKLDMQTLIDIETNN